jgi:hypothetical protein
MTTVFAHSGTTALGLKVETCEIVVWANPPEGGTVTGGGTYTYGDEVTITATPNFCYVFVNWMDDDDSIISADPNFTFTVTKDITLIANFELETCEIIILIDPPEGGEVVGGGIYACGTEITISACPNPYCYFIGWMEDDILISTNWAYSFVVMGNRTLTAKIDCGDVGIDAMETSGVNIYPNPTSGELTIEMGDMRYEICDIEIFDVFGKKVSHLTISHPISISGLPAGIYFVRIQTETGVITKKIIKN